MRLGILTIGLLLAAAIGAADEKDAVFGRWASKSSILEIDETSGVLHATIISILDPLYKEGNLSRPGI